MSNNTKQWGAIIVMIALFAMIAFVTNLCSPMAVIVKNQFGASNFLAQIGNYGNFGAYLVMGIPSGMLIKKYGYKKTALMALVVGIIGILVQWASGAMGFAVYLVGALISGACMCMLNTVVNPMLNLLGGGGNRGNQLIQTGGVFNSAAAVAVYIIMGALIGDAAKAHIADATPALMIALAIFVIAFIVIFFTKIEEPEQTSDSESQMELVAGACRYRHFLLGVLAIALYGAVEVGPPTYILQYLTAAPDAVTPGLGLDAGYCGTLGAVYFLMMLVGRFLGGVIGGKISTKLMISSVSAAAVVLLGIGIFLPNDITVSVPGVDWVALSLVWGEIPVGIFLFLLVGLCASVMWGGIFNLATEGLGKYTAIASGIFMAAVCGFAISVAAQGWVADLTNNYLLSFFVPLVAAAYILFYALIGSKPAQK
ncbi:MAG: MFS transporter [Prevotella sp.]|nr:MFS transporter [Bacteroidales bacterium]MDD6745226.1 MFS transporter [Bacteroidales bacterium]MDY3841663.1 MFS transporter [Prevotella sp.]